MGVLEIILIIVGILLAVAAIFVGCWQLVVFFKYMKNARVESSSGLTSDEMARKLLDQAGLQEVEVKQSGWFMAGLFGNRYSMRKKTIYLRRNIFGKKSVTAIAVATQKVGLAVQDRDNDKMFKFRARLEPFTFAAPALFVPVVLIGVLIDFLLKTGGIMAIVSVCLAVAYLLFGVIVTFLTIPTEKKANSEALKIFDEMKLVDVSERDEIAKLYKTYIVGYVINFIAAILNLIATILKIMAKSTKFIKKR